MKSGLRKIFLKLLHALTVSFLLLNFDQKYKLSNKNNMVSTWRNFKNTFPRPLFIIIFRPEILKFHPYSILNGDTRVELVIHCTEVRFASFLSGGFTTMAVINPPEKKLAKRTSVHCVLKIGIPFWV